MNSLKTILQNRINHVKTPALMVAILFCGFYSFAQAPGLSIGNVGVCDNTSVLVPLFGNNLSNIGAITLFISYDSQSLSFDTIESLDPQLSGLMAHAIPSPSRVSIVWSKTSGATFLSSTMLKLKFTVLQKSSNIAFVTANCELANNFLPPQVISVNYTDGSTFSSLPSITSDPENKTIFSQSNAVFQVTSPNATGFSWQENRAGGTNWSPVSESDTYSGTLTNTLTIKKVPASFNQFKYRCLLTRSACPALTEFATLSVDSVTGIPGQLSHEILHLSINPNPFSRSTAINYSVPEHGYVDIKIFSMSGKLMETPVEKFQPSGSYRLGDNFVYLPAGIYFCKYVFTGASNVYEASVKIIKTNQN
jgi:hypothetical protein